MKKLVEVDPAMHNQLRITAAVKGTTIKNEVTEAIKKHLARYAKTHSTVSENVN